jgi:hypothetical protein
MISADNSKLVPQTEEGITEVRWVTMKEARKLAENTFGSIQQVLNEGLQ